MPKAKTAFARAKAVYDTTLSWRFSNKLMKRQYGVDARPETAANVAGDYHFSRDDQRRTALASQSTAVAAQKSIFLTQKITLVTAVQKKEPPVVVSQDEHPRAPAAASQAKLKGQVRLDGTVTSGNASGMNDGAGALLLANEAPAARNGPTPKARIVGMATAGVAPSIIGIGIGIGIGPAPAVQKVLVPTGLTRAQMDVVELNKAFAAQCLAGLRQLGIADDDARVNPNGGAIAWGHPRRASGGWLVTTAVNQLHKTAGCFALRTMCIGVGQGSGYCPDG